MSNNLYERAALFLNRHTQRLQRYLNHFSARTLWLGSACFTLVMAIVLVTLLVSAWRHPVHLSLGTIHVPKYALSPQPTNWDSLQQAAMVRHLRALFYQIDSLRSHPGTKYLYDSLVRVHPGLMDSLINVQSIFLHPFTITP